MTLTDMLLAAIPDPRGVCRPGQVQLLTAVYGGHTLRFSDGPYEQNFLKLARARARNEVMMTVEALTRRMRQL